MKQHFVRLMVATFILTAVLGAGAVIAADYVIPRHVINSGGRIEASPYELNSSIGEALVGNATGGSVYELRSGYSFKGGTYNVYLPLILRN